MYGGGDCRPVIGIEQLPQILRLLRRVDSWDESPRTTLCPFLRIVSHQQRVASARSRPRLTLG